MSVKSVAVKAKKFKGFTNLFKNAKPTKPPEPEEGKKPFAGFTEAYKNFKPPEYDEYSDEDEVSFLEPVLPEEVKTVKVEYKHFVPTKYTEWREERAEAVQEKIQAGPQVEDEATGASEMGDTPEVKPPFDEGPEVAENLDDIFRTTLSFRDLNEYPTKYQLRKVNDRMRRYLTVTDDDWETGSHSACWQAPPTMNTTEAHRRHLKEYFGRKVRRCRATPIDFRRQRFDDWYSKFTFNYERKFKNMPDVPHTLRPEDFGSWYNRVSEKVDNTYRNVPENESRQRIMATHAYLGDGRRPEAITVDRSDVLSGTFPSLSHCETCREI